MTRIIQFNLSPYDRPCCLIGRETFSYPSSWTDKEEGSPRRRTKPNRYADNIHRKVEKLLRDALLGMLLMRCVSLMAPTIFTHSPPTTFRSSRRCPFIGWERPHSSLHATVTRQGTSHRLVLLLVGMMSHADVTPAIHRSRSIG